jgi:hypothetical protein
MNSGIELGKDGQLLEWRRHLLSVLMEARPQESLVVESVLHPKGSFPDLLLNFKSDNDGISWFWAHWDMVIAISCGNESYSTLIRRVGQTPYLAWRDLPDCQAIELTPHDRAGSGGITVRVERPLVVTGEAVKFQRYGDAVRVTLVKHTSVRDVFIALLRKDYETTQTGEHNHLFKHEGAFIPFNSDGLAEVSHSRLRRFTGAVAVVRRMRQKYYLLAYSNYIKSDRNSSSFDLRAQAEDEANVRWAVEKHKAAEATTNNVALDEWLNQWPDRSQKSLRRLYQQAIRSMSAAAAAQAIRNSPTGLLRYLVLDNCNISVPGWLDQRIQQLNEGTFNEALARVMPNLPPLLESLKSPAEMEWVIEHARHPKLPDIVKWVGTRGKTAFDSALALIDLRAATQNLLSRLRQDSTEGRDAAALLRKIETAPEKGVSPAQLRQSLQEIVERVERDERRPIHSEAAPPVTTQRFNEWLKLREQTLRWRRNLVQVIEHCESGKWEGAEVVPLPEILEQRLRQIETPSVCPTQRPDDPRSEEVRRLIGELLERAEDEARKSLRKIACDHLQRVILPHVSVWGLLHDDINKALELSTSYVWFSTSLNLRATERELNKRAQAAAHFLQMVAAAERYSESWNVKSQNLKVLALSKIELRKILSTPDHEWVSTAYERAKELYELLSLTSFIQNIELPLHAPTPPRQLTLESFSQWQEELRRLDLVMSHLEWGQKRFESWIRNVREEILPSLVECLAGWKQSRPEYRPAYFEEMLRLYEACFGEATVVTPSKLEALLTFLNQTAWRKDYNEIVRRRSEER